VLSLVHWQVWRNFRTPWQLSKQAQIIHVHHLTKCMCRCETSKRSIIARDEYKFIAFPYILIYLSWCQLSSFVEGFVSWHISLYSQLCSYWKDGFITRKQWSLQQHRSSRLPVSDVSCHLLRDSACKLVTCLGLRAIRGAAYWLTVTTLKLAQGYVRLFTVNTFFIGVYFATSDNHKNRMRDFMERRIL
jgi:hypothetical protein